MRLKTTLSLSLILQGAIFAALPPTFPAQGTVSKEPSAVPAQNDLPKDVKDALDEYLKEIEGGSNNPQNPPVYVDPNKNINTKGQ